MNSIHSTAIILGLLLSVVIPHASALFSNTKAIPAWAGGYVTLALATVTGFLTEWLNTLNGGDDYDWRKGALTALGSLVVAIFSHLGLLRDTPWQNRLLDKGAPRSMRRGGKPAPGPGPYEPEHEAA